MRKSFFFIIGFICISAFGCAKKSPPVVRGGVGRVTNASEKLQSRIQKMSEQTKSIKALIEFSMASGDQSRETEAALVIKRPNRIRIDAMDSLADVWAQAGSDGETLWLYLPAKKKLYKGKSAKRNLQRLLKFDLDIEDLISVITGIPPIEEGAQIRQVDKGGEGYFVTDDGLMHISAGGRRMSIQKCARYSGGGADLDYEATYGYSENVGSPDFPYIVNVKFPKRNAEIAIEYLDVSFLNKIDPMIFKPIEGNYKKTTNLDNLSESR